MALDVVGLVPNKWENVVRLRMLRIGMYVDLSLVDVNTMVSRCVDRRKPQEEPGEPKLSQGKKFIKICRVKYTWEVHNRVYEHAR